MPRLTVPYLTAAALTAAVVAIAVAGCSASPAPSAVRSPGAPAGPATIAPAVAATGALATITATGHGRASGTPDLLTVTIGVQTNGSSAHTVLQTNSAEAAALIGKLRADGVAAADIQTSQLSLNPVYANDNPPRVTGFQATDTVTVRLRQLDRAGTVIDDAVGAGGADSQVQSASYSVQDTGPLLAAAHADAVHQAVAAAKAMAAAAGVSLGSLRAVTDASPPQVLPMASAPMAAGAAASTPVPVQTGTEEVSANVSVTYAVG